MIIFKKDKLNRGFTLIELLVVISIIGFLSSVVLASMQTARDKAITAKITEDLRQVKIAAELAYGDNDNYIFITQATPSQNILANYEISSSENNNNFFLKTANAQIDNIPAPCLLFDTVVGVLVEKKYLAYLPRHPKQDYSREICYKAATSTDGSYFAAYAETPAEFVINDVSTPKSVGFVVGDARIENLNQIRNSSRRASDGTVSFLQTVNDENINDISEIADEVIGVTQGLVARYSGVLSGSTSGGDVISGGIIVIGGGGGGGLVVSSSTGITIATGTCPVGGSLLVSGVCKVAPSGCYAGSSGPCPYYPEETIPYQYTCPAGKTFVINGSENTANGTCQSETPQTYTLTINASVRDNDVLVSLHKNGPSGNQVMPDSMDFSTASFTINYSEGETANIYVSIFDYSITSNVPPNWTGCDEVTYEGEGSICSIVMNGDKNISVSD